jgi:hypothetical protein
LRDYSVPNKYCISPGHSGGSIDESDKVVKSSTPSIFLRHNESAIDASITVDIDIRVQPKVLSNCFSASACVRYSRFPVEQGNGFATEEECSIVPLSHNIWFRRNFVVAVLVPKYFAGEQHRDA